MWVKKNTCLETLDDAIGPILRKPSYLTKNQPGGWLLVRIYFSKLTFRKNWEPDNLILLFLLFSFLSLSFYVIQVTSHLNEAAFMEDATLEE